MIEGNLALPFTTTVPGVEIAAYRASQRAPADFLRVDADLLDAAAGASPALPEVRDDPHALAAHIAGIPTSEKDRLLGLLAADQATRARMELLRSFRGVSTTALPVRQRRVRLSAYAGRRHAQIGQIGMPRWAVYLDLSDPSPMVASRR